MPQKSKRTLRIPPHKPLCSVFRLEERFEKRADNLLCELAIVGRRNPVEYDPASAEETTVRLTVEQQAKAFAAYGVCVNEVCDRCGKVLAEVRWTRRDMRETYCSQLCRDGVERSISRCDGCGVDLAGKRRGARWCSDTCRMRNRVKDSANNPKTYTQKIGLKGTEIDLGYNPTRTALFTDNPKRNRPQREIARTGAGQ